MTDALRLLVALVIVGLVARTLRPAWRNRRLALRVWSGIRPRHVLGSAGLLAVVVAVALVLLSYVPVTRIGLGTLIGVSSNAVFAPIEEIAARSGGLSAPQADGDSAAPDRQRGIALAVIGGFLAVLVALFPWLAYVEERTFREGLERAGLAMEVWAALRFGLVHLVMLVPLAAALAIAVAGFAYGRIYRRAYGRAVARLGAEPGVRRLARTEAVLASTRWHATFNSLVVIGVFASIVLGL
jgi:hypothetical protein